MACLLVANLACAAEQARFVLPERSGSSLLFFSYPAALSLGNETPLRRVRSHLPFDNLTLDASANRVALFGSGFGPNESKYLPTPAPSVISSRSASRDGFANQDDDEWHFSASPQLGANHDHEKSVTFSVRRPF